MIDAIMADIDQKIKHYMVKLTNPSITVYQSAAYSMVISELSLIRIFILQEQARNDREAIGREDI